VLPFRVTRPDFTDSPPLVTLQAPFFLAEPGTKQVLTWTAEDDDAVVSQRIVFSPANDFALPVVVAAALPPGQRAFAWTVPPIGFQVSGSPAYVRVVSTDTAGQEGWDQAELLIPSDDLAGVATITSSLAGPFTPGQQVDVCYVTAGTDLGFGGVDGYMFLEGDQRVFGIGGLATTSGCLGGLEMPYVSTDTARIGLRINGSCCNRVKWIFSECFAIRPDPRIGDAPPEVTLLSPSSGATLAAGSVVAVTWDATDDEELRSFDVHASYDGGRTWHVVVADLPADARAFPWILPDGSETPDARVRVVARDLRFQNTSDCAGTPVTISGPCLTTPPPAAILSLRVTRTLLAWTSDADASGYDVLRGDLALLHSSRGSFALATSACLANDVTASQMSWTDTPGAGLWFLVRGTDCAASASYDSGGAAQLLSRDAGIAASAAACP
jgi:hypothetical protein